MCVCVEGEGGKRGNARLPDLAVTPDEHGAHGLELRRNVLKGERPDPRGQVPGAAQRNTGGIVCAYGRTVDVRVPFIKCVR